MKRILLTYFSLLLAIAATARTNGAGDSSMVYWDSNGTMKPLPALENHVLCVPAEAVAVDLRGIAQDEQAYTIDAQEVNPNCLFYLEQSAPCPQGLSNRHNIVQGMQAESVIINQNYDFYCPQAFTAHFISMLWQPSYSNVNGYSETIVLPFRPDDAMLYDINEYGNNHGNNLLKILQYHGTDGEMLVMSCLDSSNQMQAYTPYIIGVYADSRLLFVAEDAQIPATREAIVPDERLTFKGTTVARQYSAPIFMYYSMLNGFWLDDTKKRVAPFHACLLTSDTDNTEDGQETDSAANGGEITNNPDEDSNNGGNSSNSITFVWFSEDAWGNSGTPGIVYHPTSITTPESHAKTTQEDVFTLDGKRIRSRVDRHRSLRRGIYIIGNKKRAIK